ncbi:ribonuclease H70 [Schizosaccharomyces japonicus yFS275]|uniref:Ribonuclease H70 n=1 Tax=Schizosaccharomyces japonicus (strain yFS275 / FY16936) TaxID=402676 RepID=B6K314_SCHJY|nr:ribonuclease H70 [Schizosaccharomyces japonicus yFS275]EEB07871.1 ribonuclease H70 [Schizosaccharomyces japonicus yFS275]
MARLVNETGNGSAEAKHPVDAVQTADGSNSVSKKRKLENNSAEQSTSNSTSAAVSVESVTEKNNLEPKKKKKKKSKKNKTVNGEPVVPHLVTTENCLQKPLKIADLQELLFWCIADGPSPSWILVRNKHLVERVVTVLIPGLEPSLFGFAPKRSDKSSFLLPKMLNGCCPSELSDFVSIFERVWPTRSPGDRFRVHSPINAFLQSPLPKHEKERRDKAARSAAVSHSPLNYLMPLEAMLADDYPLHPTCPGSTALPEGWVASHVGFDTELPTKPQILGLDCEMVKTEVGSELARVTLVDMQHRVVYDELVMPEAPIIDYVTQFSGITEEKLRNVTTRLADVQQKLLRMVDANTILLGHSLNSDLNSLHFVHPYIIDTSHIYQHTRGPPSKPSLKWLTQKWLKREIQKTGVVGHDSAEDALACIDLLKLKMQRGPAFGLYNQDVESVFTRLQRQSPVSRLSAVADYGTPDYWHGKYTNATVACNTDDEVINATITLADNHHFVWSRLRELEFAAEWSTPAGNKTTNGAPADSESNSSETLSPAESHIPNSTNQAMQDLNRRMRLLYDSLPKNTVLIAYSGTGNPVEMSRLNSMRMQFRKEFQTKKWDECSVQWTDKEESQLQAAVESARNGVSFIALK